MPHKAPDKLTVDELDLSSKAKKVLKDKGFSTLNDFQNVVFPDLYKLISFDQAKLLLKILLENEITVRFAHPGWSEQQWNKFVEELVKSGIVNWREIAMAVCGELNPPQVGTAIASNKSFQKNYPARETMKNVMAWFYAQSGKCTNCGTRTDRISVPGWTGEGYILFDPVTGDGGFAFILFVIALFLLILIPFLLVSISPGLAIFFAALSAWNLDGMLKAYQSILSSKASDELKVAQIAMLSIVSILSSVFAILKIGGPGLATLEGAEAFKVSLLLFFTGIITGALAEAQ